MDIGFFDVSTEAGELKPFLWLIKVAMKGLEMTKVFFSDKNTLDVADKIVKKSDHINVNVTLYTFVN